MSARVLRTVEPKCTAGANRLTVEKPCIFAVPTRSMSQNSVYDSAESPEVWAFGDDLLLKPSSKRGQ